LRAVFFAVAIPCTTAAGNCTSRMPKKKRKTKSHHDWTAAEIAMLGTMSDAAVASAIGTTWALVLRKRHSLGIPSFAQKNRNSSTRWGPSDLAFFRFGYSDAEIAKITCRPIEEVRAKRAELAKG
jgi:hypothetical protein